MSRGKDRSITGFGPTELTSTSTGNTSWVRFGPFLGNTFCSNIVFTATSAGGRAVIQGVLSGGSPATGDLTLTSITTGNSSNSGVQRRGGSTLAFTWIRLRSTALATGSVTAHIAAVV